MAKLKTRTDSSDGVILWIAAGTAVGLVAGALVAERLSGREITVRSLFNRGRALATRAATRWEPLVEAALGVHDAWEAEIEEDEDETLALAEDDEEEDFDDELDDEELDDEDLDEDDLDDEEDEDEEDEIDAELEDESDDELDDDADDADEEDEEDESERDVNALDARVLEAFSNDPVLAERAVEIETDADDRIVLHGRVHNAREVAHAVTIARGVPGVADVQQYLAVRDRR